MLKQIPEAKLFEMIEVFFTGELSHGYEGKIMADKPMKVGKAMFRGKFLFSESEHQELKEKGLNIFSDIANGFNLDKEKAATKVPTNSDLISKCHTQLRRYLKFFVENKILFEENTLSFEKTFAVFRKLFSDLEHESNGVVRITLNDLNEVLRNSYPELKNIKFKIPFWEMVATLWCSWITEIYYERRFDPQNHQVVISLTDMNEFSINGIRRTFYLPEIKETQQKIKSPDQRDIWYEDGVLHFKDRLGGERIIDMSTADTQRKLFETFWSLWKQGGNSFTREKIFGAYKKVNNIKNVDVLNNEIGGERLAKIKGNIIQQFQRKKLDKQISWKYISSTKSYYFDLMPLV